MKSRDFRADQTVEGFVYVVRSLNPRLQNEIKVGLSDDPDFRRKQHGGTSHAYPFSFERVWCVSNMAAAEHVAHEVLAEHRINSQRELFHIIPNESLEFLFGSFMYEPEDHEIDCCLRTLLDLIEEAFNFIPNLRWYEANTRQLPGHSARLRAWKIKRRGATPPDTLF